MAQTPHTKPAPLSLPFVTVTSLYKLVAEGLSPTYRIQRHLLADEKFSVPFNSDKATALVGNPHKPVGEHSDSSAAKSVFANAINRMQERFSAQSQLIDKNLEFITKLLGAFDQKPKVASVIWEVSPAIRDITSKPYGIGLLKAMGMISGLALVLVAQEKGIFVEAKETYESRGKPGQKYTVALDRLLERAERSSKDRLISMIFKKARRASDVEIRHALTQFIEMGVGSETAKCRRYLEKFVPALLWPLNPKEGFVWGEECVKEDGCVVIADRLFEPEAAESLFSKNKSSKLWCDAGITFAKLLRKELVDMERCVPSPAV
ncbi:hypothetical protein GCM10023213_28380 [Prosthecobacter algae]|uniref:Uncharacterized protein n=1 Tax=Prosthecobacter algae TaxID=1144682 RepID=A0ABP9P8L4_9BACT